MREPNLEFVLVTNSVYPYHLHNVAVLALPFGATYHFRYEHRYFQLHSRRIGDLEGKIGVLVLRDFDRSTFIPLRTFRVLAVDNCGEFVFLDLQFLNFVEYEASRSELQSGPSEEADALLREREKYSVAVAAQLDALKIGNTKKQHLAKLIVSVT